MATTILQRRDGLLPVTGMLGNHFLLQEGLAARDQLLAGDALVVETPHALFKKVDPAGTVMTFHVPQNHETILGFIRGGQLVPFVRFKGTDS